MGGIIKALRFAVISDCREEISAETKTASCTSAEAPARPAIGERTFETWFAIGRQRGGAAAKPISAAWG